MKSMNVSQLHGQGLNFHVAAFKSSHRDCFSPILGRSRTFY